MIYDDRPLLPPSPREALDQPIEPATGPGSSVGRAPTEVGGRGFDSLLGPVPDCKWCGGRGYYIGGDELHVCWCVQPDEEEL